MRVINKWFVLGSLLLLLSCLTEAKKINTPVTTAFTRVKKMEEHGIIIGYKAVLDSRKLGQPATAFIFASFWTCGTSYMA